MIESQIRYVAEAIAAVDKYGAQALAPTRGCAGPRTTKNCSANSPAPSGTPAGAEAGTSTSTASTGPCGAGMTWEYWLATRASSSPRSTRSSAWGSAPRWEPDDKRRDTPTTTCRVSPLCRTPVVVLDGAGAHSSEDSKDPGEEGFQCVMA